MSVFGPSSYGVGRDRLFWIFIRTSSSSTFKHIDMFVVFFLGQVRLFWVAKIGQPAGVWHRKKTGPPPTLNLFQKCDRGFIACSIGMLRESTG